MSNERKKGRKITLTRERVFDLEAKITSLAALMSDAKNNCAMSASQLNVAHQQTLECLRLLQRDIIENDEDVCSTR